MNTTFSQLNLLPKTDPYLGLTKADKIPADVVDWVLLEIRTNISSNSVVAKKAAFLDSDGKIVDVNGTNNVTIKNISEGNYYLVIKHRNHLSIMSSNPIHLSENSALYDFTIDGSKAYGNDAMIKLDNNLYGMYSGDGDSNGIINIMDYKCVGNYIFNSGYSCGDLDMNSIINIKDYNNSCSNLFKTSKVPN